MNGSKSTFISSAAIQRRSAGAGSILYHLAAQHSLKSDDSTNALFSKVIPQSPVVLPLTEADLEDTFETYMKILGVRTLDEAKGLPTQNLMRANQELVSNEYYAEYNPGMSS